DLALDLLHELLDAGGGGQRLLALEQREGGLVLLVGEVDLEGAADNQRPAHERDEERDVLPEQPALRFDARKTHEITGSLVRSGPPGRARSMARLAAAFVAAGAPTARVRGGGRSSPGSRGPDGGRIPRPSAGCPRATRRRDPRA